LKKQTNEPGVTALKKGLKVFRTSVKIIIPNLLNLHLVYTWFEATVTHFL